MVILPKRIEYFMEFSQSGFWFSLLDGYDGGPTWCFFLKVPASCVQAIKLGTKVELILGCFDISNLRIPCVAIRVWDDSKNPLIISRTHHLTVERTAFIKALASCPASILLYDEYGRPVARGTLSLESNLEELISAYNAPLDVTDAPREITEAALDLFQKEIFSKRNVHENRSMLSVDIIISDLVVLPTISVGVSSTCDIRDKGGDVMERTVHQVLSCIYPKCYLQPYIRPRKKPKVELTDVLAFDTQMLPSEDHPILLVESKSIAGYSLEVILSTETKTERLEKHIDKAFEQLQGAIRILREGRKVFDSVTDTLIPLPINAGKQMHAIIV